MAKAEENYSYEVIKGIADHLLGVTSIRPKIGIVCGSGLGGLAELITDREVVEYASIPNFPVSTVQGHSGRLNFGYLADTAVVAMQGRFHYYEGYSLAKCSMPVRVMRLLGIEYIIITNAAGGANINFKVGDIMIIRDHINWLGFAGNSPLRGPNDPRWGPRFPPISDAYTPELIEKAQKVVKEMGIESEVHLGVYSCLGGPTYETIAEVKLLQSVGVDAVGMSTVSEVITAKHCGMKVFAFSLITNKYILDYDKRLAPNHAEVVNVGELRANVCGELVIQMVKAISADLKK